ncbi:MAG: hypothetical protein ACRDLT_16265 [Solirubrobacteraceae bacterium]
MPPAPQQTDPRREQLRRQAIQRRQAVIDRVVATRTLLIGAVLAGSCIMAGYLDASARPRATSSSTDAFSGSGYTDGHGGNHGSNSGNYGGDSTQGLVGGGSAPSASSGAGTVVSGGS